MGMAWHGMERSNPYLVLRVARDLHPSHRVHQLEVRHKLLAIRRGFSGKWQRHFNKAKPEWQQTRADGITNTYRQE